MPGMTNTTEVAVMKWATGQSATPPTSLFLALTTTTPTDSAAGTEVTNAGGSAYVRKAFTPGVPSSGDPTTVTHASAIRWDNMPSCTVTGVEVWDSLTTGVRWFSGPLTASKTLTLGDSLEFAAGAFQLTLD
jgi:hypothetical protein